MPQQSDINLVHTITLVMGDWSHDGHSKTYNAYIKSNLDVKQIQKAYEIGSKAIKIDLVEDICADYEDQTLKFKDFKKFIDAGFLKKYDGFNEDELKSIKNKTDLEYIDTDLYLELYLFTVFCGSDKFKYEILENPDDTNIDIGGYGLFS